MKHKANLSFHGPGKERIMLGDVNVSAAVSALTLDAVPGKTPVLTLTIPLHDSGKVDGALEVEVDGATSALLKQMGWTPPALQCGVCGEAMDLSETNWYPPDRDPSHGRCGLTPNKEAKA